MLTYFEYALFFVPLVFPRRSPAHRSADWPELAGLLQEPRPPVGDVSRHAGSPSTSKLTASSPSGRRCADRSIRGWSRARAGRRRATADRSAWRKLDPSPENVDRLLTKWYAGQELRDLHSRAHAGRLAPQPAGRSGSAIRSFSSCARCTLERPAVLTGRTCGRCAGTAIRRSAPARPCRRHVPSRATATALATVEETV